MTIDVGSHISELLFKHDSVSIPGLGGLIATYKSSTIDHVQGLLYPPAKMLNFDRELNANDGVLVECVRDKNHLTLDEAQELVTNFVSDVKLALEKREIIVFPNVGRLYKDYEQNFQFLQDNTNFNTDSFGLPTIQFYPVLRSRGSIFAESDLEAPSAADVPAPASRSWKISPQQLQTALPAIFLIGLLSISFYFFSNRSDEGVYGAQKLPVSENRINKKPSENQASFLDAWRGKKEKPPVPAAPPISDEEKPAPNMDDDGEFETAIDTESITTQPGQKEAVIIIGAFSKKAGVKKRIEQIYDLGYDVYQDKMKGLNRVGVQFSYENDREKNKVLALLRKKFDTSAYFLDSK